MAEVTLDSLYDNDDFRKSIAGASSKEIHLTEREDGGTIEKVMGISVPNHSCEAGELTTPISIAAPVLTVNNDPEIGQLERLSNFIEGILGLEQPITENEELRNAITQHLSQLEPEEFEELERQMIPNPDRSPNYLTRLQNLVAAILDQLQQISEKDKEKINQLEKEYKKDTLNAANLQKELGWNGLKFAAVTFGASFLQFLSPYESDRAIANIFAKDVCPRFGELWNADLNARLTSANNSCTLKMNKYNFLAQGEQSKANDKQQVTGVLDKALRGMESASRAGG